MARQERQSMAGPGKDGQGKAGKALQDKTGRGRAWLGGATQGLAGQALQDKARRGTAGRGRAWQGRHCKTRQDQARQGPARQGIAWRGWARQAIMGAENRQMTCEGK